MAESVFSLASNILSTIASQAFEKAYERVFSIQEARDELTKLRDTMEMVQAKLLDAERKQEGSTAVKIWIKRLKGVLYDADDLFDEVATDDLLNQRMMKEKNKLPMKRKVLDSVSNLTRTILSRDSIAKQVKAIRQSLDEISKNMIGFEFESCVTEEAVPKVLRRGQDPGWFVDAKEVIGRDEDKKAILEVLFNESDSTKLDSPVVISVVGIGGMGKTTFAQLIYNDEEVKMNFEKRWFACISDTCDEKEVIGKIFQSISRENYSAFDVGQIQTKIRDSIVGKKCLLVLDDVWDDDHARWKKRMSLLDGGAKGSKIIVTTRSPLVAKVVGSLQTHNLDGLSEDESWSLFKRVAFTCEKGNDPRWTTLGREIVKKCRNVPLAIISIGSLLFERNTIQEWESFKNEELSKLKEQGGGSIMNALKLSYDHLPSYLKQCFAYCSLFPKDAIFVVRELIYLWIAQGYIESNHEWERIEEAGESCFMYLLRRGFFQEPLVDEFGEIESCKMHDLIHDLALHVAGEESTRLTSKSLSTSNCTRHISIGGYKFDSRAILAPFLNVKLCSCLLRRCGGRIADQIFENLKFLRALDLSHSRIENVSHAIGELKHLRYLDLSRNKFEALPDSITNLVNLLSLDINMNCQFKTLPNDLRKLINLRCLNISYCVKLKHMPGGIGEMSGLQYLSDFKVGKSASQVEVGVGVKKMSRLNELVRLQHQLRGELLIEFKHGIHEEEVWDGDECRWQLPVSPQKLEIVGYPGRRIADWGININRGTNNNLASLELRWCEKLKYLPPLRCLPNLRYLTLYALGELEYVEEEENSECIHNNANNSVFFPRLEKLKLGYMEKLKGWWRKVASMSSNASPHFPRLSQLSIECLEKLELKSFPVSPHLRVLDLMFVDENKVIQQQLPSTIFCCSSSISLSSPGSTSPLAIEDITIDACTWLGSFQGEALTSLCRLKISRCWNLTSLHLASPHLQHISITECYELTSFELLVEAPTTSLRALHIEDCDELKNLHIAAHLNALEELTIVVCPELKLWESSDNQNCHIDWDSLTNLRQLRLDPLPPLEKLPHCLRQRNALGQLVIVDRFDKRLYLDSDGEYRMEH